ncbi:hypothetical protein COXBURSA334_1194 [Coxiella burnetii Q321]|nr:hypothetical protein COXBURSA334_1194 [Coxiella burnetii Q321]
MVTQVIWSDNDFDMALSYQISQYEQLFNGFIPDGDTSDRRIATVNKDIVTQIMAVI